MVEFNSALEFKISSQQNRRKLLQLFITECSYNFIKFSMCSYNFNVAVRISIKLQGENKGSIV